MNDVPADLPGLLTILMAGSGVFFGLVSVKLINILVAVWERRSGAPVSGTKKRWISIGVPATLVLLGYAGLLLLGTVPFTQQTAYLAAVNALAAAGSKQALYAAIQSADKPQVVNNIGTVQAERDLFMGSTVDQDADPRDLVADAEDRGIVPGHAHPPAGYYVLSGHYAAETTDGGTLNVPLASAAIYLNWHEARQTIRAAHLPPGWAWSYVGAVRPGGDAAPVGTA